MFVIFDEELDVVGLVLGFDEFDKQGRFWCVKCVWIGFCEVVFGLDCVVIRDVDEIGETEKKLIGGNVGSCRLFVGKIVGILVGIFVGKLLRIFVGIFVGRFIGGGKSNFVEFSVPCCIIIAARSLVLSLFVKKTKECIF